VADVRVTYVGHATVLSEAGGTRVLTDPLLRPRLGHLRRHGAPPQKGIADELDAVLISHLHLDHLDPPSLRTIARTTELIVPSGAGHMLKRLGFARTYEVQAGDEIRTGGMRVLATHAEHDGRRRPLGGAEADTLGFVVEADGTRIYFAGDTDLFDGMETQIGPTDLALLPVWGWGPTLGDGHLDPQGAAQAAALLRPRVAVPIHWGTFFPMGLKKIKVKPDRLTDPPHEFARYTGELAPEVDVRVLEPGDSTAL
jgi:L-ascorbate metabolism protein UlaG (beta-lactamase superfamily)